MYPHTPRTETETSLGQARFVKKENDDKLNEF